MTHRTAPRRIAALAVLSLTALAACGGDDEPAASGDSVAAPATSPAATPTTGAADEPGLRAPTPIEYTSGAAGGPDGSAESMSADSRVATDMLIAPTYVAEFVVADDLPPLPTDNTGYVYPAGTPTTPEQAAELAALFGVAGEPVRVDEWVPGGWQVGPTDGTAASLFLSDDGQHTWNFSPAWDGGGVSGSVACTAVPGTDPSGTAAVCAEPATTVPAPPVGILTADAATARATELLGQLGVDTANLTFEPYADEWSASVSVSDASLGRYWGFGFGAEGVLQWANGTLATPDAVGPYDLIDLDAALARLDEQYTGAPMAIDVLAVDAGEAATSDMVGAPEPMLPDGTLPAPEPVTVTLVDVQADRWWAFDADGSVWLLPAYRFIGDDGGWYTVPAVTDEYLVQVDPPVAEPADTASPVTTAVAPTEPDGTSPTTSLDDLVGLSLDEFTAAAESRGWTVRVTELDGQPQPGTMDYRDDRVNIAVTGGTVTTIVNIG